MGGKSTYNTTIEFTLLLIFLLLPISSITLDVQVTTIVTLASLLLIFIWILKAIEKGELCLLRNPLNIPIIIFVGLSALSLSWSIERTLSIYGLINILNSLAIFFIIVNNFHNLGSLNRLFRMFGIYVLLISGYGILQYLTGTGDMGGRAHSLFVTPNTFAGSLILTMPLSVSLYLASQDKRKKAILLTSTLIIYLGILTSAARAAWISLSIPMALALFLLFRKGFLKEKGPLTLLITSILIAAAFFSLYKPLTKVSPFVEKVKSMASPLEVATAQARFKYWMSAWEIVKRHPVSGTGIETFSVIYPLYQDPSFRGSTHTFCHNDYLQILSELGPAGLIILLFIIITYFLLVRRLLSLPIERKRLAVVVGISCGSLATFIHSLMDFDMYIPFIMAVNFAWFACICIIAGEEGLFKERPLFRLKGDKRFLYAGPAILFSLLAFLTLRPYIAEVIAQKGRGFIYQGRYEEAIREFQYVLSFCSGSANYHGNLARVYNILAEEEKDDYRKYASLKRKAEAEYLKAIRLSPYAVRHYRELGAFYMKGPDEDKYRSGLELFKKASTLRPQDAMDNLRIGFACLKLGMEKEARREFVIYKSKMARDPSAFIGLATALLEFGRRDEAIGELKKGLMLAPDNRKIKALLEEITH
ncbi:O-antigen ligase family protein [bacterium]|nr:O-antigen ligase family protein [bacterium]